ncbi:MAG: DUF4105 domain-containing protein [Myxococcales bacterium]|nr:DUF4105 domain-containing protein [Myxococcales bacterium]MCB9713096.1 DUF4105 domain-containing protein [Myxococcales bacterium]
MRPRVLLLWLWLGLLLCGSPASAAAPAADDDEAELRIDLITIGPGDPLLTRAGHTALLVTEHHADGRVLETVYNYGDTDFGDPWIPVRFLFARLQFFASVTGDLYDTTMLYGRYQDRDMIRQPLALTQPQARALAAMLERDVDPASREYDYHYLEQTCSTKVRDRLDEVTGGELRRQLAELDPWTVRDYQQLTFDGDPLTALLGDVLFGRLHDRPITKYYALLWPQRVSEYLSQVMVPDPTGAGGLVPLAGEPVVLAERGGPPRTQHRNPITWWFAPLLLGWALAGAAWLARSGRERPRLAALWLTSWSLPSGLLGLVILVLQLTSTVPELRSNELIVTLPATDLVLVVVAIRWWRKGVSIPRWLERYAGLRLGVGAIAVAGRAVGVLVQQPWVIPAASLGCSLGLWWLARRWRRE